MSPGSTKAYSQKLSKAQSLRLKGQHAAASAIYKSLLDDDPENKELHYLLGTLYFDNDQKSMGLEHLSQACDEHTSNTLYLSAFADALGTSGYIDKAAAIFDKILHVEQDNIHALIGLGSLYSRIGKHHDAISYLDRAYAKQPSNVAVNSYLAHSLSAVDEYDKALMHARKNMKQAPNNADSFFNTGKILVWLGRVDEAERLLKRTISLNGQHGNAYELLTSIRKTTPQDKKLVERMEKALQNSMTTTQRDHLHFALGKAYDDLGEWDNAFQHFSLGNRLLPSDFNKKKHMESLSATKKVFNENFFRSHASAGNNTSLPIFIVGMPRSGTTLLDQLLSSHASIESVGESPLVPQLISKLFGGSEAYPSSLTKVDDRKLMEFSNTYLGEISSKVTSVAERVVDKQPFNFLHLGLLATLFPSAKLIYLHRNPLDVCLSCFFQRFADRQLNWSTDLSNLGQYYRVHHEFMAYWKKVLPVPILQVEYEELVEDFETHAKRIVEHCNLQWDPACAEFYKSGRAVRTASTQQVRQPIYKSSKARWKRYSSHIAPLVASLGELVADQQEELKAYDVALPTSRRFSLKKLLSR